MKKIVKFFILTMLLITGIQINAFADSKRDLTINSYEVGFNNGMIGNFSDGSFYYIDKNREVYEFTPSILGDWNYSCDSIEELDKLVSDYRYNYENYEMKKGLGVANQYIKHDGTTIIEFNDNSWAYYNKEKDEYIFMPAITTDTEIKVDNMEQLKNIITTYYNNKMGL